MLLVYVFLLVLGAGFAAVSLAGDVLGGDAGDADLDIADGEPGWWKLLSLQGIVYGALAFGAVGTLLHLLWGGERGILTGFLAGGAGLTGGALVTAIMGYLKRSDAGRRHAEASFEGLPGRVILPLSEGGAGRVRIRRGEREFVLRALPYASEPDDGPPEAWSNVVVVEVRDGVAWVTPAAPELDPPPP